MTFCSCSSWVKRSKTRCTKHWHPNNRTATHVLMLTTSWRECPNGSNSKISPSWRSSEREVSERYEKLHDGHVFWLMPVYCWCLFWSFYPPHPPKACVSSINMVYCRCHLGIRYRRKFALLHFCASTLFVPYFVDIESGKRVNKKCTIGNMDDKA